MSIFASQRIARRQCLDTRQLGRASPGGHRTAASRRNGRHVGDPADRRRHVAGTPITPWQRVALAADFTSPFANSGDAGLSFINTDITLYLHKLPATEWIGFEVVNHGSTQGVAIAECYLYDEQGPIGSSSVTALAQPRPM